MIEQSEPQKLIGETTGKQMRAATPHLSAWVSANAGSGKTHVLSQRVVRLLLNGTSPSAILCLTYTKTAAAEMSLRIFDILAQWTRMDDDKLRQTLTELEGKKPSDVTLSMARQLFAWALETPGGLKIQTIHAFCESLLHRFPLEANVVGNFKILDDMAAQPLLNEARVLVLDRAEKGEDKIISHAVQTVLDHAGEQGFNELVEQIISKRHALLDFIDFAQSTTSLRTEIANRMEIDADANEAGLIAGIWPLPTFSDDLIESYYSLALNGTTKTPKQFSQCLMDAKKAQSDRHRLNILHEGFLTQKGEACKTDKAVSKEILDTLPDIYDQLKGVADHILKVNDLLKRKICLDITEQALLLARNFIKTYEGLKRRQAMLDYDDLIIHTASLFKKRGAGSWVHYKLDRGIDHILVDEAQDTSPGQWHVIQSLADEFYAGKTARNTNRTIFAVGDEKQSIYSFQGAKPERFDQERRQTIKRTMAVQKEFESISLRVSFRSTSEVLDLVDLVFSDDDAKRGLSYSDDDISHQSVRQNAPGQVELWPLLAKQSKAEIDNWLAPFDVVTELDPIAQLSRHITAVLKSWIGKEKILDHKTHKYRPICAGDILILVRKRDAFVPTLMKTLKTTTTIPVAGADRLQLTEHIAIQDLIALGRVVLLPDDDLSLASLLKSPLFNVCEDQIFTLCANRNRDVSLWRHLCLEADKDEYWKKTLDRLRYFENLAHCSSVHDFYNHVLSVDGVRQLFLDQLGNEVTDILDDFLVTALEHDKNGIPGLQNFLIMLEQIRPEIKREQEQGVDAIRIMTVHASKGLEAPIVFLVDPGSRAFDNSKLPSLRFLPPVKDQDHLPSCPLWVPKSQFENEKTSALKVAIKTAAEEEYRRLLYVGLTRAADRLIICGYCGIREVEKSIWHELVERGFDRADPEMVQDLSYQFDNNSWNIKRFSKPRLPIKTDDQQSASQRPFTKPLRPSALDKILEKSDQLPRPLAPSGASIIIKTDENAMSKASPFTGGQKQNYHNIEYGKAIHRLLQVFPNIVPEKWNEQGYHYLKKALPDVDDKEREDIIENVISVLTNTNFSSIFSAESVREISVMGKLIVKGEERVVSGSIDRLIILEDKILIMDYKTNAKVPSNLNDVPQSYIIQLAIYRTVLQPLYQEKTIEAALLYTRTPSIIEIPADILDKAIKNLSSK